METERCHVNEQSIDQIAFMAGWPVAGEMKGAPS